MHQVSRDSPNVAFRVDGSSVMGAGHLKRCQSLAQAMIELGAVVTFVSRPIDDASKKLLSLVDVPLRILPETDEYGVGFACSKDDPPHAHWAGVDWLHDAQQTIAQLSDLRLDWLVVDHYSFDARWHNAVRLALKCRLLVIDDTADRSLCPDVLLDQNWSNDFQGKYADFLRGEPARLMGPRYALLSAAYRNAPRKTPHENVRSIGVFMGGTDLGRASELALRSSRRAGFSGLIEVVTTSANPELEALIHACAEDANAHLSIDEADLVGFYARHDLHIGAGGGATWERCCMAVPTIGLALAENQRQVIDELGSLGALCVAQFSNQTLSDTPNLEQAIKAVIGDATQRRALAKKAGALVDGYGSIRVGLMCLKDQLRLEPVTMNHAKMLLQWRNHPDVRRVSRDQRLIDESDHLKWIRGVLSDPSRLMYVAKVGQVPVGSIRFDRCEAGIYEVSLYADPTLTGLGLGKCMLTAGDSELIEKTDALKVVAEVVEGNLASMRLFAGCGYQGGPKRFQKILQR